MPYIDTPRINQPTWFDLATTDLTAAMRFYGELFGWTFEDGGEALGHYTMAHRNGRAAAGIVPIGPGPDAIPTTWRVYLGVENAAATVHAITAAGGAVVVEPMDVLGRGHMALVTDPEGALFGLWEAGTFAGAGIEGEPGSMCWAEVNTRRPADAVTFYSSIFGLRAERMQEADRDYFTLHIPEGPAVGGIFGMTPDMQGIPPHWMPYFVVESLTHGNAVLARHGGTQLHGPIPTPHGHIIIARDAQGGVFSYMSTVL